MLASVPLNVAAYRPMVCLVSNVHSCQLGKRMYADACQATEDYQ